jgi:hypothetical protein
MIPASQPDPLTPQFAQPAPKKSSAVKAGWICLILGFLTFWIFGFGFVFFVATFVLAIVAMSTNRLDRASRYWFHRSDLASFAPSFRSL